MNRSTDLSLFEIVEVGHSDGEVVVGYVQLSSARCRCWWSSSVPPAARWQHVALQLVLTATGLRQCDSQTGYHRTRPTGMAIGVCPTCSPRAKPL